MNPTKETARRVFKSIGGFRTIGIVAFLQLAKKYYDWHNERVKNEFDQKSRNMMTNSKSQFANFSQ